MNTDSFIVYIKADDIYKGIVEGVEKRFDNSNYEMDRQLPKGINKKNNWIIEKTLREKSMKVFVGLRAKSYNYLINDGREDKKAKVG